MKILSRDTPSVAYHHHRFLHILFFVAVKVNCSHSYATFFVIFWNMSASENVKTFTTEKKEPLNN